MNINKRSLKKKLYILSVAQKIIDKCFILLEKDNDSDDARDNIINSLAKLMNIQKNLLDQEKEISTLMQEQQSDDFNSSALSSEEISILKRYLEARD